MIITILIRQFNRRILSTRAACCWATLWATSLEQMKMKNSILRREFIARITAARVFATSVRYHFGARVHRNVFLILMNGNRFMSLVHEEIMFPAFMPNIFHVNEMIILNDTFRMERLVWQVARVACETMHHLENALRNEWPTSTKTETETETKTPNSIPFENEWIFYECMSRVEIKIISRLFTWKPIQKFYECKRYVGTWKPGSNNKRRPLQRQHQPNGVCRFVCIC